jgi:hypothetical protein
MDFIQRKSAMRVEFLNNLKYIEATKLVLVKLIDQNIYEGRILLKNLTTNFVIYKIFTNSNMKYSIAPSQYFIQPAEAITVTIKLFEKNVLMFNF